MQYNFLKKGILRAIHKCGKPRNSIKAVILDWSGTTVDPHVIAPAVAFKQVFEKHQVPITIAEARLPMGMRKDLHIQRILEIPQVRQRWKHIKKKEPTPEDAQKLFEDFVPIQLSCLRDYTSLVPGTADTIKILREKFKVKIGSTTGFTKEMVDVLLKEAKVQGYIPDSSIAGDEVENDMGFRPAPFMLYKNLIQLGVFPISSVVKVDDTITGVQEGLNAGCWSVGIYGNSNYTNIDSMEQWEGLNDKEKKERLDESQQKLISSGAHYIIESIQNLPDVIENINHRIYMGEKP